MATLVFPGYGNKSETNTAWCDHCGWHPPPHNCPIVVMSTEDEAAALASLNAVSAEHPATGSHDQWKTIEGWEIWVFDDCGEWDYIERIIAPDGRVWMYPHQPSSGMAMTDAVSNWSPKSKEGWPGCDLDLP